MLQLKQTLHNTYTMTSTIISTIATELQSLSAVPPNSVLAERLGKMLLSLALLISISVLLTVTFTLNLLLLLKVILMKLLELFSNTGIPGWNVQSILCRWADAVKNIPSMLKRSQKPVCNEDGDSLQDSTSHYSEMPGELKKNIDSIPKGIKSEAEFEKIRRAM